MVEIDAMGIAVLNPSCALKVSYDPTDSLVGDRQVATGV